MHIKFKKTLSILLALILFPTIALAAPVPWEKNSATTAYFPYLTNFLGIGTTSPYGLFSINPNGITGPAFVIGSSTKTDFVVTRGGHVGIGSTTPWGMVVITNPDTDPSFIVEDSASPDSTPFVITSSGSVGISTSSPTLSGSLLTLASSLFGIQYIDTTAATGRSELILSENGVSRGFLQWRGSSNASIPNTLRVGTAIAGADTIITSGASASTMTLTSTGNVGIGSTTPMSEFVISNANTGSESLVKVELDSIGNRSMTISPNRISTVFTNSPTANAPLLIQPVNSAFQTKLIVGTSTIETTLNTTMMVYGSGATTNRTFATRNSSNTETLTVLDSGNVGIASTSPRSNLVVSGTTHIDGFLNVGSTTPFEASISNEIAHFVKNINGYAGVTCVNRSSGTTASCDFLLNNDGTDLAGGVNYGDLGINGMNNADPLYSGLGGYGSTYLYSATNNLAYGLGTTSATAYHTWTCAGFLTANRCMTLLNTGNLGIGTTSPSAKLSIEASAGTSYTQLHGSHFNLISSNATTPVFSITGNGIADTVNVFDGTREVFTILDGGNVGISTSTPYRRLSVAGNAVIDDELRLTTLVATGTISAQLMNSASYTGTSFDNTNSGINIVNTAGAVEDSEASLRFSITGLTGNVGTGKISGVREGNGSMGFAFSTRSNSSSAERMRLSNVGYLGIATTTPSAYFHIDTVAGADVKSVIIDTDNETSDIPLRIRTNASAIAFQDSDTVFVVDGLGNTGIGATSTPWRRLSVVGTMAVTGLTDATGAPSSVCINATTFEVLDNAASTCTVSDRDQKNSIEDLDVSATQLLSEIRPVVFKYNGVDRERWGFIAQELQSVDPKLGDAYRDGEARSIDIPAILAVTVKAVQELQDGKIYVQAKRSVEENYQWAIIGLLVVWNIGLTIRRRK